jgi:hypothetical protein
MALSTHHIGRHETREEALRRGAHRVPPWAAQFDAGGRGRDGGERQRSDRRTRPKHWLVTAHPTGKKNFTNGTISNVKAGRAL